MQVNAHLEQCFNALGSNTLAKMHQLCAMAGHGSTKFSQSTKGLVIRITLELQHHGFITQVLQLLEQQQTNHQATWFGGSACALGVMLGKGLLKVSPGNHFGEFAGVDRADPVVREGRCQINWFDARSLRDLTFIQPVDRKTASILTVFGR